MKRGALLRKTALVSALTALSRVLGLAREVFMAQFFGTSLASSAFFTAFRLPNLFRAILGEGALSAAFVPVLTESIEKDGKEQDSWVESVCRKIGKDSDLLAPPDAVKCIRDIIVSHTKHDDTLPRGNDEHCTTDVDANLLESWRRAAQDPDDAVCQWLLAGAPEGTLFTTFSAKPFFLF